MKRIMFAAVAALTILVSGYSYVQNQNGVTMSDLALENIEALAHGEGNVPNKFCPIWNVSYTESWTGTSITCETGGAYKCAEGICPHNE